MAMAFMRAKMRVTGIKAWSDTQEDVSMMAATGKDPFGPDGESEDNTYARYTPSGTLTLSITNPALLGKFHEGQTFYLDFTEAE
jgi:hypothetical protein